MLWKNLMLLAFTFFAVDVTRLPRRHTEIHDDHTIVYEHVIGTRKEKKVRKSRDNKKWKKRKDYELKTTNYNSSRPKSHRFSNQKSLRRMYRNC